MRLSHAENFGVRPRQVKQSLQARIKRTSCTRSGHVNEAFDNRPNQYIVKLENRNAHIAYTDVSKMCAKRVQSVFNAPVTRVELIRKVQVGKDQEKAQSEKDSHSKNQGGKKPN